jgi:uncharacterized protein involved in exopolysaccharide biosynthesis
MAHKDSGLEKIGFIWQNRKGTGKLAAVYFLIALIVILLLSPVYVVTTTIFPKESPKLGGSSSLFLGAVGLNPLQNAMVSRMEVLLTSVELAERAVVRDSLLPELFPQDWDAERKAWKDGKAPLNRVAAGTLSRMIRVEPNSKGLITISAEARSPKLAARVLSAQLGALEERIRADAELDLKTNLDFLNKQLSETGDPLLRDKILALMASYIEGAVYANAKSFDLSETPRPPLKPAGPRRGVLVILALIISICGACVTVLGLRAFREIRLTLKPSETP